VSLCVFCVCVYYYMAKMIGLLQAKNLIAMATVLLETETDFSSIDFCFSYQVSPNDF
jgi:hypothetical protein